MCLPHQTAIEMETVTSRFNSSRREVDFDDALPPLSNGCGLFCMDLGESSCRSSYARKIITPCRGCRHLLGAFLFCRANGGTERQVVGVIGKPYFQKQMEVVFAANHGRIFLPQDHPK
ncbi:uncharacterized protein PV09_04374 [Verruconis gallopava]|uniref:Uncharacterized protein n=1 Tax=Verruconis gallopava TaxID=253628 RepID=A0A0D2ACK7_9PEZI|nr:uncharacterized protein PV09_04374 [Verruconis gallopava]KIW04628.1 hypothetical protein PV09_04374 [Verruconis gallopava]